MRVGAQFNQRPALALPGGSPLAEPIEVPPDGATVKAPRSEVNSQIQYRRTPATRRIAGYHTPTQNVLLCEKARRLLNTAPQARYQLPTHTHNLSIPPRQNPERNQH